MTNFEETLIASLYDAERFWLLLKMEDRYCYVDLLKQALEEVQKELGKG